MLLEDLAQVLLEDLAEGGDLAASSYATDTTGWHWLSRNAPKTTTRGLKSATNIGEHWPYTSGLAHTGRTLAD